MAVVGWLGWIGWLVDGSVGGWWLVGGWVRLGWFGLFWLRLVSWLLAHNARAGPPLGVPFGGDSAQQAAGRPSVHRCGGARDVLGPATLWHHRRGVQPCRWRSSGGLGHPVIG